MGLFGTSDKKSEIERLKKRIEQEKDKIKSCQTNIALIPQHFDLTLFISS